MALTNLAFEMAPGAVGKYLVPDMPTTADLVPYLRRIDESRWYSNFGPLVCELETQLRAMISAADPYPERGSIHLTSLASGHHALEIGLKMLGIGPGKTVLVPALTFPATALAARNLGAHLVLADVDAHHWSLTPRIARNIATRAQVDAVMPVAVFGVPLPTSDWDEFQAETGISVVIDAAAAVESQAITRRGLVAHSLHATKPFGVGEGGILAARNAEQITASRQCANFGMIERITWVHGTNAKMSEYHAAVGLAQMKRWKEVKARRTHVLRLYLEYLRPLCAAASLQPAIETSVASCVMVLLTEPIAATVGNRLRQSGVAVHNAYLPPLYRHPYFSETPVADIDGAVLPGSSDGQSKSGHMSNCEALLTHLVGVPFHSWMTEADVAFVVTNMSL